MCDNFETVRDMM